MPVLRGEALPLPAREIRDLRERLDRAYADHVVATESGPLLVIRVPHREPDFLRDLEAAVDVMPYRDLTGFRGVLLVGDRAHMGVSTDMLRALIEGRRQSESDWVADHRRRLDPGAFVVARLPSDPKRRLRAVFRVDVDHVADLDDDDFDRLAEALPEVKRAAPGQNRPARAYLVAEEDHVDLDGAAFFGELERRRRRKEDAAVALRRARDARSRLEDEERHDLAVAHLERILEERRGAPRRDPDVPRPDTVAGHNTRSTPPGPQATPTPERAASASSLPPLGSPSPRLADPVQPIQPTAAPGPDLFRAASEHGPKVAHLRKVLERAGYKLRERLVVDGRPFALAGARRDGYPTRILVSFLERLGPEDAKSLLTTGRGVGAELILAVVDEAEPGVERVCLATNLKVIPPAAVEDLRFH